jgi:hypothetical protein
VTSSFYRTDCDVRQNNRRWDSKEQAACFNGVPNAVQHFALAFFRDQFLSVSLGAERLFRLKRKNGSVAFSKRLPHGSLLIVAGNTQKTFKHEVPKEPGVVQPRINLTFRRIEHG